MSVRTTDDNCVAAAFGRMYQAGRDPHTWRAGEYFCVDGLVTIYEHVDDGEQFVRLDTVMHGRQWTHTETRTTRHLTERGIYIVAGRWLRSLCPED